MQLIVIVFMTAILVLALAVTAVVIVGMQGRFSDRSPRAAHMLSETAQVLNGDKQVTVSVRDLLPAK